jgi:hypothetical protein
MLKLSRLKHHLIKRYQQSTNMCSCGKQWGETISLLPTLTPSQRSRNCLFTMKCLEQHDLYDNNIHAKFQGQNIYTKK